MNKRSLFRFMLGWERGSGMSNWSVANIYVNDFKWALAIRVFEA